MVNLHLRVPLLFIVTGCLLIICVPSNAQSKKTDGLTLEQVRAAYGIDKLLRAGIDGSGQTVAIVTEGGFKNADIDTFAKQYSLPAAQITTVSVGSNNDTPNDGSLEWTMDTEIGYSMPPKETILVF